MRARTLEEKETAAWRAFVACAPNSVAWNAARESCAEQLITEREFLVLLRELREAVGWDTREEMLFLRWIDCAKEVHAKKRREPVGVQLDLQ